MPKSKQKSGESSMPVGAMAYAGYVRFHNIVVPRVDHGLEKTEKMTLKARVSD